MKFFPARQGGGASGKFHILTTCHLHYASGMIPCIRSANLIPIRTSSTSSPHPPTSDTSGKHLSGVLTIRHPTRRPRTKRTWAIVDDCPLMYRLLPGEVASLTVSSSTERELPQWTSPIFGSFSSSLGKMFARHFEQEVCREQVEYVGISGGTPWGRPGLLASEEEEVNSSCP